MKAIIVCGAREALDRDWSDTVRAVMSGVDVVIHGACGCDADTPYSLDDMKGIDYIAHMIANYEEMEVVMMRAPWTRMGKAAGPFRNMRMLNALVALGDCGYEIAVLGFHDDVEKSSRGTKNMIQRAKFAGVPYAVYDRSGHAYLEGNTR